MSSNQRAFEVAQRIVAAAHDFEFEVEGRRVRVATSQQPSSGWPSRGVPGVSTNVPFPGAVAATCTWTGGAVTLLVGVQRETVARYDGDMCLAVSAADAGVVWCNLRATLDRVDDRLTQLVATVARTKRDVREQDAINAVLRALASRTLPMASGSKVLLAEVDRETGELIGGAAPVFERVVQLALLKLEFVAPETRTGVPLIDLAGLGLGDAARAVIAGELDDDAYEPAAVIRDAAHRAAALELLAFGVENAHDERPDGWALQARNRGLQLVTGRLLALRITRAGALKMSVMGPIAPELRVELGAEPREDEAWKAIPGGLLLRFPASSAARARERLSEAFDRFVDQAMARTRRPMDPAAHEPAALAQLAAAVGRALPSPAEAVEVDATDDDGAGAEATPAARDPVERGRAPIFDKSQRTVMSLLGDIERGLIALPDLQRPFVWEDVQVVRLLDSLFVGFPAGSIVLWQTADAREARAIGSGAAALQSSSLVIDGQQRLTSLYAAIKGVEVVDKNGDRRRIKVAFRPRDGRFDVPDAAILQNPEYIADIAELWSGTRTRRQIRMDLLRAVEARGHAVDDAYAGAVEHNLERVEAIGTFEFPLIEIRHGAASDEDVADIFVRINNQGTRLNQADFVLTLLSVFHGSLRDRIEERAAAISESSTFQVDAKQLLRASCAVGFERARMSAIYSFLRGIDPATGDTSKEKRAERLATLDVAAAACIDATTWRDYLVQVAHAGFVHQDLVASPAAVVNAFAFYVRGLRVGVARPTLGTLVSRWLFGTLLTRRYSGSSETVFEADLVLTRGVSTPDRFVGVLEAVLDEVLTRDYWSQTLTGELRTQRSNAPSALAFRASQIVLGARTLFGEHLLQTVLSPGPAAGRAASERHHLFPKAWLVRHGVTERREINQVANLADLDWINNADIGASAPASYVPRLRDKLKVSDARWGRMCAEHALPDGWETLDYREFLEQRRMRMAQIIRTAFRKLEGEERETSEQPPWFLPGADEAWGRIADVERRLRAVVRATYTAKYGAQAAARVESNLPDTSREALARSLRSRPAGSDPLSVLDYLYLAQLPELLFANDVWADARTRLVEGGSTKQRLSEAVATLAPVRNEIAHVREVSTERLRRAIVACDSIVALIRP